MIEAARQIARRLLGFALVGRRVTIYPDDVLIVSYPKSGNTWTRFLIGNLVYPDEPMSFANIERKVPDIYHHTERNLQRLPRPRILKSHEYFDPRCKTVVYIVRDPRDVAISYYHYHVKVRVIEEGHPLDQYVPRFTSGAVSLPYGSWGENVGSWLGARQGLGGFLLLRYEEMLAQPLRELHKVASFLGITATEERLERVVQLSSADSMRALEKSQSDLWKTTQTSRKDKPFVRSATAGQWKAVLSPASVLAIESAWGRLMTDLGYCLSPKNPHHNHLLSP